MALTSQDVKKIANLARLELSDIEVQEYTSQLSKIVEFIETLNKLDVSKIEPTAHAVSVPTPFRKDEVKPFKDQEKVLSNSPDREDNFFRVPKVM